MASGSLDDARRGDIRSGTIMNPLNDLTATELEIDPMTEHDSATAAHDAAIADQFTRQAAQFAASAAHHDRTALDLLVEAAMPQGRALGESPTYLNYAVWESTAHYRAAFGHPEFRAKLPSYPSSVVASPHLFQKVAVPNICVA